MKKLHLWLVLVLGLVLGGAAVWMLGPGAFDPMADAANQLVAPQSGDDDADSEHAKAQALASSRATQAREAGYDRNELDSRGEQVGARLAAAAVLVQGPTGAPIADALVEAKGDNGITDQRRTDAEGKATIMLPACEVIALRASADGLFPAGIAQHPFGDAVIIVLGEAALVSGTIKDSKGEPVAGAWIEPRGPAGSPRSAARKRERSDESGKFKVPPIVPGTYDLWVEPPTDRGPVTAVAGLYVAAGPSIHDVELAPGRALLGKVKDAQTGALIGGARLEVRVDVRQGQLRNFTSERRATTDELGAFAVTALPLGVANVLASAQGHTPRSVSLPITTTEGAEEIEITLDAAISLFGRTLSVDGEPVSGADVVFGWWANDHLAWSEKKATSDADGHYELGDLPVRDAAFVCLYKEGYAPNAVGLGKLVPGEKREVDVRFQLGVEVRGIVRGEDGKFPSATLKLVPRLGAERFTVACAVNGDGTFALRSVAPFAYRLEVSAEGYIPFAKNLDLDKSKPVTDAGVIELAKAFELTGLVVRRPGSMGVPSARVNLVPVSDKQAQRRFAITDDFGEFVCTEVKAGTYRVFVDGVGIAQPREVPVVVNIPQQKRVRAFVDRADVLPTGGVYGRLLESGTGKPVEKFQVPGIDGRRLGKGDGSYWITGLATGRVDLRFDSRGYQSAILPGIYVRAGEVVRVRDVYLQAGGKIDVVVRDQAGKPIPANQLKVTLTDTQLRTLPHNLQPFDTNLEKAVFRFDGLALSNFELKVAGPKGLLEWKQTFDVLSVETKRVDVRLQPVPPPKPKPAPPQQKKPAPGKKDAKPPPQQPKK